MCTLEPDRALTKVKDDARPQTSRRFAQARNPVGPGQPQGRAGQGWINVYAIGLAGSGTPLPLAWLDDQRWRVTVPLNPARGKAFRKFKRAFVPEGHYENSPAFQRWDRSVSYFIRPEGTAESVECGARAFQAGSRPSLRDLGSSER